VTVFFIFGVPGLLKVRLMLLERGAEVTDLELRSLLRVAPASNVRAACSFSELPDMLAAL
jgi:hypothetical protein